jgi:hypothetical protein
MDLRKLQAILFSFCLALQCLLPFWIILKSTSFVWNFSSLSKKARYHSGHNQYVKDYSSNVPSMHPANALFSLIKYWPAIRWSHQAERQVSSQKPSSLRLWLIGRSACRLVHTYGFFLCGLSFTFSCSCHPPCCPTDALKQIHLL